MLQGQAEGWRSACPRAAPSVTSSGEDGLAVGAERHGTDRRLDVQGRPMGWPVAASQSRAVLSSLPVSDGLAVGAERHGSDMALMRQGWAEGRPVAASQSRAVRSELPVRTVLPSGLNATARRALMLQWRADGPAGGGVPEPRRLVDSSR